MEITRKNLDRIIKTGNLYFHIPAKFREGLIPINSYRKLIKVAKKNKESDFIEDFSEIFTYWDDTKKKPLFDIFVSSDQFITTYELSDFSLCGMYWLQDGNRLSTGMENFGYTFGVEFPVGMDLEKYTLNNYNVVKAGLDFV
jgi:5,10-methylenetetrahydrofolate reductase